jgi:two-component system chemotaxis response regulator CheY
LVQKSCKEIGFQTFTEAKDGAEAYIKLEAASPPVGLIISDWNMPNSSGMDLLKRIRATEKYKNVPLVLVTAESEKGQIVEAIKAGVSNYVVKPFTTEILREKLEAVHKKIVGNI